MHNVDDFLSQDSIICGAPSRDETTLQRGNEIIKKGSQVVDKCFSVHFEKDITQTDGSEVLQPLGILLLRDQDKEGLNNVIMNRT